MAEAYNAHDACVGTPTAQLAAGCFGRQSGYCAGLSTAAQRFLALQGGLKGQDEATRFADRPSSADAIRLRRRDDAGKLQGLTVPPLMHFLALAEPLVQT